MLCVVAMLAWVHGGQTLHSCWLEFYNKFNQKVLL
jgi:hypothetical protein